MTRCLIIADDLTGAADAAAPFAVAGCATAIPLRGAPPAAGVLSVSTNSRDLPPDVAVAAVRTALSELLAGAGLQEDRLRFAWSDPGRVDCDDGCPRHSSRRRRPGLAVGRKDDERRTAVRGWRSAGAERVCRRRHEFERRRAPCRSRHWSARASGRTRYRASPLRRPVRSVGGRWDRGCRRGN